MEDEEMIANLLFSDGAAAVILCGDENNLGKDKTVLRLNSLGSAVIPSTSDLMTWNISSTAFRMFLSTKVVDVLRDNIHHVFKNFLREDEAAVTHWAIHPGGVKIVEAVQQAMNLSKENVADSLGVLKDFGNMSSPTILFILENMFNEIRLNNPANPRIFACAFGPGVNVEMISMSAEVNETQTGGLYEQATQA
jgi:predicted naringenin-chalcone synthase